MAFNSFQIQAIESDGHTLITACPGSGKTTVLSARAGYKLTQNDGNLLSVTFTSDAALELKDRILKANPNVDPKRITVGTFHALALRQVKKFLKNARIIEEHERHSIIQRISIQLGVDVKIDDAIKIIDSMKSTLTPDRTHPLKSALYDEYQNTLNQSNLIDFNDILIKSVQLMRDGSIQPYPVRFLFGDEYQDADAVQYEWIKAHGSAGAEITLVGDDDQSIYGFRSATGYSGMMKFRQEFGATLIELPINYRCGIKILAHARKLIELNKDRVAKQITAGNSFDGDARVLVFNKRQDEVNEVADVLSKGHDGWAILARNGSLLDSVESALSKMQIPYHRVGGKSFWDHKAAATFLGFMRAFETGDWIGIACCLQWANVSNGIIDLLPNSSMDKWASIAKNAQDNHGHDVLTSFNKVWNDWNNLFSNNRINLLSSAVGSWMGKYAATDTQSNVINWATRAFNKQTGTISQRINSIKQLKDKSQSGSVPIMTFHASKGLEFDHVWMIGCENNVIPDDESPTDEERRLFYVAMTRAKKTLTISWRKSDLFRGKEKDYHPSRFIRESFES